MNRLSLIIFIVLLVGLTSCKSHKATVVRPSVAAGTVNVAPSDAESDPRYSNDPAIGNALVRQARTWIGTPYRYGGKSKSGTDCSGMVMALFDDVARLSLPRNSAAQRDYCFNISKKNLEPGDLVFFSTSRRGGKVNHVGIYAGKGRMIHASSSRGVIESSLDEKYYVNHYHSSGRVYGITYAARGGKKPKSKSKDEQEILLASDGFNGSGKDKRNKSGKAGKTKSKSGRKSGSEALAVTQTATARPSSTTPIVEMTLDEFVAMRQSDTQTDTVVVVEQVIGETVAALDSALTAVDSVMCGHVPAPANEVVCDSVQTVPADTVAASEPEQARPVIMVNGRAVEAIPVEKRPAEKRGSVPADTVRQAAEIRATVVKAMKFGK